MNLGDVFLLPTTASDHIWLVAYKDLTPSPCIVVFNFTTRRSGILDDSCIITQAEYTGLRHDSVIAYRAGRIIEGSKVSFAATSVRQYLSPLPASTLRKIQEGAIASKYTAGKIKVLIRQALS